MKARVFVFSLFITCHSSAQWSTKSNVDSALFVCYGFFPGIFTYQDGSSIILGALSNSIYAQKLDEFGYKQWTTNGVLSHNNDSSYIGAGLLPIEPWGSWVTDGDGGIIFFWYDHRGSDQDSNSYSYLNTSVYAQRVDKNGNVRWLQGGLKVKGPETGLKRSGGIVEDGAGGCIIAWAEDGFNYPGAPNVSSVTVQRLSGQGMKLWEQKLDSSTQQQKFYYKRIARIQERVFVQFFGSSIKLIDTSGNRLNPEHPVVFGAMATADSTIYNSVNLGITRQNGDTTWYQTQLARFTKNLDTVYAFNVEEYAYGQFYSYPTPIVPDGLGGMYSILAFQSSDGGVGTGHIFVQHADGTGVWPNALLINGSDRPYAAPDESGGVLVFNAKSWGYTQRYDRSANPLWSSPVQMVPSILDIDNPTFAEDHHGGIIMAFWTPSGTGVYAQHSGRVGRLGVLTSVPNANILPISFTLKQNYPNPFNPMTTIEFALVKKSKVSIRVHNMLGQEIENFNQGQLAPGVYRVKFDGTNLPSGTYFYTLSDEDHREVKRMLLLK